MGWTRRESEGLPGNKKMKQKLLSRPQILKLTRLLYMKYKPSEIADILDINVNTIYRNYIPNGCPHERDANGYIWIIGSDFREWAQREIAKRRNKQKIEMKPNQGYCVRCNKRVTMNDPKVIYSGGNREIIQSVCPLCGGKVNRARGIVENSGNHPLK